MTFYIYIKMNWWRKSLLKDYETSVEDLRRRAREWGLTEDEINFTLRESLVYMNEKFPKLNENSENKPEPSSKWLRTICIMVLLVLFGYGAHYYKPAHNFVERNIQEVIYPFMKLYRRVTLPIVQHFPSISELYDESCLVENPYFQVADMDCWPCEKARFVMNLTDSISNAHVGLPFVMKYSYPGVSLKSLKNAYSSNKELIDSNSARIQSNVGWRRIEDVLEKDEDMIMDQPSAHVQWRINRMEVGRVLRSLLKPPRDGDVPPHATSIGIERFLLFDGPMASHYPLPATEGANVFLKQLTGERLIVLEPAPECRQSCRRLSFLLEENYILWYNWWYWRPRSFPAQNSTSISIGFMGSTV